MKRILTMVLMVILSLNITACTSNNISTTKNSGAEKYKKAAQEYINNGDMETARKALQEGVALTGDNSLKEMLDELNSNLEKMLIYASDGQTREISKSELNKWIDDGWYTYPVIIMYDPNGEKNVISESDKDSLKSKGWSEDYIPDDETIKFYEQGQWGNQGITMTISHKHTNIFNIKIMVPGGWYIESGLSGDLLWDLTAKLQPDGSFTYSGGIKSHISYGKTSVDSSQEEGNLILKSSEDGYWIEWSEADYVFYHIDYIIV